MACTTTYLTPLRQYASHVSYSQTLDYVMLERIKYDTSDTDSRLN